MVTPKIKKSDLKEFIEEYIFPLYRTSHKLKSYGDYLKMKVLADVFLIPDRYQKLVLGGVQENGEFGNNSLAQFYYNYFGIGLIPDDRIRYIKSAKSGLKAKGIIVKPKQENEINCNDRPSLYLLSKKINDLARSIIQIASEKRITQPIDEISDDTATEEFERFIDNPSVVLDLIAEFYNNSVKILPTHNEFSLFTESIHVLPRDYALIAYPVLKNEMNSFIEDFDLEIRSIVDIPSVKGMEYVDYIWPRKDGIVYKLSKLNRLIFMFSDFLNKDPLSLFDNVTSEWEIFLNNARLSLDTSTNAIADWIIGSKTRSIQINIDENGFIRAYGLGDNPFDNSHISVISKAISPLLFSGALEVKQIYSQLELINRLSGVA